MELAWALALLWASALGLEWECWLALGLGLEWRLASM